MNTSKINNNYPLLLEHIGCDFSDPSAQNLQNVRDQLWHINNASFFSHK